MAEENKKSIRQLIQEQFQQEVARELGIDLSASDQVSRRIRPVESDSQDQNNL